MGLVFDQGQHVNGKGGLELCLGKEPVQHHLGVGVPLQLHHNPHTSAVRLVPNVGNTIQPLFIHLIGHVFDEHSFVDLIGNLRHNDPGPVLAELFKMGAGPKGQAALARGIGRPDPGPAQNDGSGGEVRPCDVLHQIHQGALRIL